MALAQYLMNGLMLGMMYALVAVGFTLFFGVLDVIKFSHGDVLTVGAFTALATYLGLKAAQVGRPRCCCRNVAGGDAGDGGCSAMLIARYLVLPLRSAPALNTLLITLDAGHRAARRRAAVLSAGRQSEAVPGAAAERPSISASSTCGSTT